MGNGSRVLVITHSYPRHERDCELTWMRELHRRMRLRGHKIKVLTPAFKGSRSHVLDGIEVTRFRFAPSWLEILSHNDANSGLSRLLKSLLMIPFLLIGSLVAAWTVWTQKFDVIHVHWPMQNGLIGHIASLLSGKPLVMMTHGQEQSMIQNSSWMGPILKQSLRHADLLISNNSQRAHSLGEAVDRLCYVLPYGSHVEQVRAEKKATEEVSQILVTGQLDDQNDVRSLLEAAPKILRKHNAKFIIAGEGSQRTLLESLRNKLRLENSVDFIGQVPKERLRTEYANCDIWVNSAFIESTKNTDNPTEAAIEAYNNCKPVIANSKGDLADTVVDGETGYLVPDHDAEALATAIDDLLSSPEKREKFGKAGFVFAQSTFSWPRVVRDLELLYEEALGYDASLQFPVRSKSDSKGSKDQMAGTKVSSVA